MSRGVRIGVAALAVIALLALGIVWGRGWWRYHQTHVSTDDAYVHADVAQVTSRVPGTIVELAVEENWRVRPGDLLVRLDRQPLEVKLRKAEATLAAARARVNEMRAAVQAAESEVRLAEAEYEQARLEHARAEKLAGQGAAPATRLDRSRTDLRAAEARLASARRGVEEARAGLGVPVGAPADEAPVVRQAQAALEEAQLFLSYTDLRAPLGGVVARRSVEIGQRVESGQPLMMIVPLDGRRRPLSPPRLPRTRPEPVAGLGSRVRVAPAGERLG
jgi:membrane fusion protein (multidrug efflux system)